MKIYFWLIPFLCLSMMQCKFEKVEQSNCAHPEEIIKISLTISDNFVPEPNAYKGVLCMLVPMDWSFVSGNYSGSLGTGELILAPEWADSVEFHYTAFEFGDFMKWIAVISDTGFAYSEPITINIAVDLQVGHTEGCFNLGYLATKAKPGIIGTSWSPLSYPHCFGIPDSCQPIESFKVESAPEWDALFNRTSGWTGSDGVYSIPISGCEIPSGLEHEQTLFVFGDTFIGEVDSNGHRNNITFVNNTYAILNDKLPLPEQIRFFWNTDENNRPVSVFVPKTPCSKPDDLYWPMDGISLNDTIYVFTLLMRPVWQITGVSFISFTIDSSQGITSYDQIETPLYYENEEENWNIILGQAVMPMTEQSGNANPDGYIYIYGPKSGLLSKELVAARFLPENIKDFSNWEFWNGQNWSNKIEDCAAISNQISQEFSVTPLNDGRYLLVFQIRDHVAIHFGESPTGPFDFYKIIWNCPEVNEDPDIFVYNAKAHPHLSEPMELLISYNVNTFDNLDHITNANIYRPRFIRLYLENQ